MLRCTAQGVPAWARAVGGSGFDGAYGAAWGPVGALYVSGFFSGTASFGAQTRTSAGGTDVFVARFDATGTSGWAERCGGHRQRRRRGDGPGRSRVPGRALQRHGPVRAVRADQPGPRRRLSGAVPRQHGNQLAKPGHGRRHRLRKERRFHRALYHPRPSKVGTGFWRTRGWLCPKSCYHCYGRTTEHGHVRRKFWFWSLFVDKCRRQ